jgi:ATP-dependent helicase HrpB
MLPIHEVLAEVKQKLQTNNTLILQAPPGAGKSTVLPIELLNQAWLEGKKIILLEPRRLAVRSVAQRLAELLGEKVGETVGYRIRFDTKISSKTRIEVVTEGILTRQIQQDNALENVGLVIFDEFHERSLNADLALALSREVQQVLREDLRLLIMSATLNLDKLSVLLDNAPIVESKGRQYPIEYIHIDENRTIPLPNQLVTAIKKAVKEQKGDLLVFVPGVREINKCLSYLSEFTEATALPLHGNLPLDKQRDAIKPFANGQRKIVLATSIAETSLTIEGITTVIDSGYARVPRFDPRSGLSKLDTIRVTQDAADQRAGRAGRTSAGVCYRVWSKGIQLEAHRVPEILEADLCSTVLELANWGIQDTNSLTWLTPPPKGAVAQSNDLLEQLGALQQNKITAKGKEILTLPTHPRIAHLLLEAKENKLLSLAIDIAAILEERDPLPNSAGTDINLRIEAFRRSRQNSSKNNFHNFRNIDKLAQSWYKRFRISASNQAVIQSETGFLLSLAYPERIAKHKNGTQYQLANNRTASLFPQDNLINEQWLAIGAMNIGKNDGQIFLASPIDPTDLPTTKHKVLKWNKTKGELIAQTEVRVGDILLKATKTIIDNEEKAIETLCEAIKIERNNLLPFSKEVTAWQCRVMSLKKWNPKEDWPTVTTEYLFDNVQDWLAPYLSKITKKKELQKLDLLSILQNSLPWGMNLEEFAPQKFTVPSGSSIKLTYFENGQAPVLAARLQEVFGLLETPKINKGKNTVLMHLLSPGYKPVQVTSDLHSFWDNTYIEVKKELKRRYPKHSWPDDPWTATAVRGVKKR